MFWPRLPLVLYIFPFEVYVELMFSYIPGSPLFFQNLIGLSWHGLAK